MTLQEMFDTAARGIISQGGKSTFEDGGCAYRGENGRKCAAGWLLPNDLVEEYEGQAIDSVRDGHPILFSDQGWLLLEDMQMAHDDSHSGDFAPQGFWAQNMRAVAAEFDLSTAVLDDWESEAASE